MDIMIPPNEDVSKILKNHFHTVHIEDVEEWIQSIETPQNVSQKRQGFFDYFPTYAQVNTWLDTIVATYPQNTQNFYIGSSYLGTQIRGIRIFISGGTKRSVFLNGAIHAREWITVTSSLYIVQQLLTTRTLLNSFDFYIVPVFNVDGYDYTHRVERLWRKSRQPNAGSTCVGTDINRNFAFAWNRGGSSGDACSETFRGATAESAPETRAIARYIETVPRLAYYLDVHCCGSMFMSSWGYTSDYPTQYNEMLRVMTAAQTGIRSINGNTYAIGTSNRVIYAASGVTVDWVYGTFGVVPSFTVEHVGQFVAPVSSILPLAREIWSGFSTSVTAII